jgi:putative PEP-CTERM system TPR-repeat lipoprotein
MTNKRIVRTALALTLALSVFAPGAWAARAAQSYYVDAQAQIAKGDYKTAIISLRNAVKANPNDASLRLQLANVYMKLENYPAAEAWARLAQQVGGSEDQVDPLLARAMELEYRYSALIQSMEPGSRAPAAEAAVRVSLATAHLMRGDIDIGEHLLVDAQRLDASTPLLPLGVARLKMARGDLDGAEAQIVLAKAGEAGRIAPDHVLRLESEVLSLKGDRDGALAILNQLLARNPDDLATIVGHADIMMGSGDFAAAQKDVDHALALAPGSLTPSYLNALLLTRRGDLKQADEILTAISQYFNALPSGYYLQGLVKFELDQHSIATDALLHYLGRRPNDTPTIRLLAVIALSDKAPNRVIELLRPVVDADPADIDSVGILAKAYIAIGQQDAAVDLYQQAAAADPDDVKRQADAALMRIRYGSADAGFADLGRLAMTAKGVDVAGPVVVLRDLRDGDVSKAETVAENLVQHGKDDLSAQNVLGEVRLAQYRFADAEAIFQRIIAADPTFFDAKRNLARTYLAANRPDDAKRLYESVLAQRPKDVRSLVGLADLAEMANQVDEAAERLVQARAAAPNDRDPALRLVSLYALHKDWEHASQAAKDLIVSFPRDPQAIDIAASVRGEAGDKVGAANDFYVLTQLYPRTPAVFRRYAEYQIAAGDVDGARQSLDKAMVMAPDDFSLMHDVVAFDFAHHGIDAALDFARSESRSHPAVSDLLVADALVMAKRQDEAIAVLTRAENEHPTADITLRLADLIYRAGKHDDGEQLLAAWIEKHDDEIEARLALAELYRLDRDDDKAQALYEFVLKRAPTNALAVNNLATIYARKHDPRATDLAQRAFRLLPGGITADTLGWTLLGAGDAAASVRFLQDAAGAMPQDMAVQYHLAVALAETGDTARARALLERVVKSDAPFDGKDDAKRRLVALGND